MSAREFLIDLREDVAGSLVGAIMPAFTEKEATRVTYAYKYIMDTAMFYSYESHGPFTLGDNIARYSSPYEHRIFPELDEPEVRGRIHDVARGAAFAAFKGIIEVAHNGNFMRTRLAQRPLSKLPGVDAPLDYRGAIIIPRNDGGYGLMYSPTLADFAEYYWPEHYADNYIAAIKSGEAIS